MSTKEDEWRRGGNTQLVQSVENYLLEQHHCCGPEGHSQFYVFFKPLPVPLFESHAPPKLLDSRGEVSDFLCKVALQIYIIVFIFSVLW